MLNAPEVLFDLSWGKKKKKYAEIISARSLDQGKSAQALLDTRLSFYWIARIF